MGNTDEIPLGFTKEAQTQKEVKIAGRRSNLDCENSICLN